MVPRKEDPLVCSSARVSRRGRSRKLLNWRTGDVTHGLGVRHNHRFLGPQKEYRKKQYKKKQNMKKQYRKRV